jgi:predicted MFS family arabinose efflux permease
MNPHDSTIYARRWKTLAVLAVSLAIIGLDNTILNVALPSLQEEFDASSSTLQWMVDSYLLVFAALLLTMGTLGDRFGRKLALQTGLVLFGGASLCVLFVETSEQLIAVRAVMGIGGAMIMPATCRSSPTSSRARSARRRSGSGPPWRRSASASVRCSADCSWSGSTGPRCSC